MASNGASNAVYNLMANVFKIASVSALSFVITGLLVRSLGMELFGVVPLVAMLHRYIGLSAIVLSASVGRFVSIAYFNDNIESANRYYSTAFFGLILIIGVMFTVLPLTAPYLSSMFSYPREYEQEVLFFFIASITATLLATLLSVFNVIFFIKHAFYVADLIAVVSKAFLLVLIVIYLHDLNVGDYGTFMVVSTVISLVLSFIFAKKFAPDLRLRIVNVSRMELKDMAGMGFNSLFISLGSLLYVSSDVIIANLLLGSFESGQYGIVVQCGMVISMIGGGLTLMISPVIAELVAEDKQDELILIVISLTKIVTFLSAIPFVVFVLFSNPIFDLWLGIDHGDLAILNGIVVGNFLLHQTTSLSFVCFNMMNRLRLPAIMTLCAGVFNVLLSISLVHYTEMGLYGIALATSISIFLKTVIFNACYASSLLNISPMVLWYAVIKGLLWPVLFCSGLITVVGFVNFDSFIALAVGVSLVVVAYMAGSFAFQLTFSERRLVKRILKLSN